LHASPSSLRVGAYRGGLAANAVDVDACADSMPCSLADDDADDASDADSLSVPPRCWLADDDADDASDAG